MKSHLLRLTLLVLGFLVVEDLPALLAQTKEKVEPTTELMTTSADGMARTTLLRDGVNHGWVIARPKDRKDWGNPSKDFSRLATTYYHRRGPLGRVLELYNWFGRFQKHEDDNTFAADARMPTSLIGLSASTMGSLPSPALVAFWSEPPLAILGLNAGTLAVYARPFQHVHFYEPSDAVIKLSVSPKGKNPTFHNVHDALQRGARIQIHKGEERATLAKHSPDGFYQVMVVETSRGHPQDPTIDLLTKEAMELFFQKMSERGIVCYHTSSRNYNLVLAIADAAKGLGFACLHARDPAPGEEVGHYTSEWVMVARKEKYLSRLTEPPDFRMQLIKSGRLITDPYWIAPAASGRHLLTDRNQKALKELLR